MAPVYHQHLESPRITEVLDGIVEFDSQIN
jgi:hypothetical protein